MKQSATFIAVSLGFLLNCLLATGVVAQNNLQTFTGILGNVIDLATKVEQLNQASQQQPQQGGSPGGGVNCQAIMNELMTMPPGVGSSQRAQQLANIHNQHCQGGGAGQPAAQSQPARRQLTPEEIEAQRAAQREKAQAREVWQREQNEKAAAKKEYEGLRKQCLDKSNATACQQAYSYPDATTRDRERIAAQFRKIEAREQAEAEARVRAVAEQQRLVEQQRIETEAAQRKQAADALRQRILAMGEQVIGAAMQSQASGPIASASTDQSASSSPSVSVSSTATGNSEQPSAASMSDMPAALETRARLEREVAHVASLGFQPTLAKADGGVAKEGLAITRVGLIEGVTYAIVAACGDCHHVQLGLFAAQGQLLANSPETADAVILGGTVPATGEYAIGISVPGCQADACHAGMRVMKQPRAPAIAAAPGPEALTTATIPSLPTAVSPQTSTPRATNVAAASLPRPTQPSSATSAPGKFAQAEKKKVETVAASPAATPEPEKAASPKMAGKALAGDGGPKCKNTETTCSAARNVCIRDCRQREQNPSCSSSCQQSFQLCRDTGAWSTRHCQRTGLLRE